MLNVALLPMDNELARLRVLRVEDADAYADGTEDFLVRAFAHLPEPKYTPTTVKSMINGVAREGLEGGHLAVLAIADTVTDEFAGSLVIFDVTSRDAEVGFWLHPQFRGSGLASAALKLACDFAEHSGLGTLTARTVPGNHGSHRVLSRAGFAETHRQRGFAFSGEEVDMVHYARMLTRPSARG